MGCKVAGAAPTSRAERRTQVFCGASAGYAVVSGVTSRGTGSGPDTAGRYDLDWAQVHGRPAQVESVDSFAAAPLTQA